MTSNERLAIDAALARSRARRAVVQKRRIAALEQRAREAHAGRARHEELARRLLEVAKHELPAKAHPRDRARELRTRRAQRAATPGSARTLPAGMRPPRFAPGEDPPTWRQGWPPGWDPHTDWVYELFTLDTATLIAGPAPDGDRIQVGPYDRGPLHNAAHVYLIAESTAPPPFEFDVGSVLPVQLEFVFTFVVPETLQANVAAFVKPRGSWIISSRWSLTSDGSGTAQLTTGLDLAAYDPSGAVADYQGTRDTGLDHTYDAPSFSFEGGYDIGDYDDTSALFYNHLLPLTAQSTLVCIVWVDLLVASLGDSYSSLELMPPDGVDVPAVYLATFR
jgi:hypothetical protein